MRITRNKLLALSVLLAAGLVAYALANDSSFGGIGANIYPMQNTVIALEREHVTFEERDERLFDVTAELTFFNPSRKAIHLQLGFPVHFARGDEEMNLDVIPGEPTLEGRFRVFVNDVETKAKLQKRKAAPNEFLPLGVYVFAATFPPRKRTVIRHRYAFIASINGVTDLEVPYVFQTGGNWRGNIEQAVFEYRLRAPVMPFLRLHYRLGEKSEPLVGLGRAATGNRTVLAVGGQTVNYTARYEAGPAPRLTVTFHDLKPKGDLFLIGTRHGFSSVENGPIGRLQLDWECQESLHSFYHTPEHPMDDNLAKCFAPAWLRNFLYASHGYAFQDEKWRQAFYGSGMFLPSTTPFDESWLTPGDRATIEKLKAMER